MALIEVQRDPGGLTDHLRSYDLLIDWKVVGRLQPGDSFACEVVPGFHEVFVKLDWCRSERIDLQLAAGHTARLFCAPRANLFTGFYWTTFGRRRYIRLTEIED